MRKMGKFRRRKWNSGWVIRFYKRVNGRSRYFPLHARARRKAMKIARYFRRKGWRVR